MTRRDPKPINKKMQGIETPPFPANKLPEEAINRWQSLWENGSQLYTLASLTAAIDIVRMEIFNDRIYTKLLEQELVVEGSQGQAAPNPYFKIYHQNLTALDKARDRFGANPRAASEIGLAKIQLEKEAGSNLLDFEQNTTLEITEGVLEIEES